MATDLTRDTNTSDTAKLLKVPPRSSNVEDDSGIGSQSMNPSDYFSPDPGLKSIKYIDTLNISCGPEGCQHSWDDHGFSISIPVDAVQNEASIMIGVSISGKFVLPVNMTLVSAVFCVDASPSCFEKDVELKIPHNLELSEELSEHVSFVRASCSTSSFNFEKIPGGVFKPGVEYGVLSTKSFSLFAVVTNKLGVGLQNIAASFIRVATVHVCMPENRSMPVWQVYVYVSLRNRSIRKHIRECNSDRLPGKVVMEALKISYSSTLSLRVTDTSSTGWNISTRTQNQILWEDVVDYSRSAEYPPYIALEVKNTIGSSSEFPGCKLSIVDDAGKEVTYCRLPSNPTATDRVESHQGLTMELLVTKVVPRLASHWEQIGYALDLDKRGDIVNIIKQDHPCSVEHCCQELFRRWLNSRSGKSPKTWETLLEIISNIPELTAVKEELQEELQNNPVN